MPDHNHKTKYYNKDRNLLWWYRYCPTAYLLSSSTTGITNHLILPPPKDYMLERNSTQDR